MLRSVQGRISGPVLRALSLAMRRTPVKHAIARTLREQLGITALRRLDERWRGPVPTNAYPVRARTGTAGWGGGAPAAAHGDLPGAAAFADAYRRGATRPSEVVERIYRSADELARRSPGMNPLLYRAEQRALEAARDSEDRLRRGQPRGPLEGVPIAVKEEVNVAGLPTRLGTAWMPEHAASSDSVAVARLRAAGAVIVGNTPMTEYGLSPLGGNIHRTMPRNVHAPDRLAGGSSTGSAVAVGSGLVPLALGADGGGSVRIPAALNGVFGLKPTYGRVPTAGHGLSCGSTVVHVGPIGASTYDLALFVEVAAGAFEGDLASMQQPSLPSGSLLGALDRGVNGLKIGIPEAYFEMCDRDVQDLARAALRALREDGAVLVAVDLPLGPHAAAIGYLTIGIEAYVALDTARHSHLSELGPDVQMLLSGIETLRPDDYVEAQRYRSALRAQCAEALHQVDVLALPTTACVAPPVTDDEARSGFIDSAALDAVCRFAFLGNVTGLPAGTAPVGHVNGLPVGLQIIADAWDEASVLSVLSHLERTSVARPRRSPLDVSILA